MTNYYNILGVTPNANSEQIKKAYRRKAKFLHPDINKAENAHEEFILLNEAYEFLINTAGKHSNTAQARQQQAKRRADYQQQWEQQERVKARARAQEYARMKYEAYIKSDVYKTTEAINVVVDFIGMLFMLLLIVGLPIFTYIEHGPSALIISAIILLPTSPLWFRFLIRSMGKTKLESYYKKDKATLKSKITTITIMAILNLIVFFKVALNTLMELQWILAAYIFAISIAYLIAKKHQSRIKSFALKFAFAPGIINLLFLLNFFISSNPMEEYYWFNCHHKSPLFKTISLEDHSYDKYRGIRFFLLNEDLQYQSCIKYTIKNGILGFKSAHDIEFLHDYPSNYLK